MTRPVTTTSCACGSGRPYGGCCEPFHAGGEPPDATALMRSRYAAFVLGEHRYLFRTLHPEHEDHALGEKALRARLEKAGKRTRYHGLAVLDADGPDASGVARVLFSATLKHDGKDASFVELSSFAHDGTGWRYLAGRTFSPKGLGDVSRVRIRDLERM